MTRTTVTSCHAVRWCEGCGAKIPPSTTFLEHELESDSGASVLFIAECVACAARNGRPGFAEPDVAEQPLDLEGVGA